MNYDAKYKDMQTSVERFYSAARSLDGYVQRLESVKNQLAWFVGLSGYKNGVGSRATAVSTAAATVIQTGQCLDNSRIEYLLSEQIAYQMISGDTSFNIGDGVAPVNVPELKGVDDRNMWEKLWGGIVNVGKTAVKVISQTWSAFQDKIKPGGDWYKGWQIVKTVGKVISGTVAFVGGCLTLNPLAIIYGANDLLGAGYDIGALINGDYGAVDSFNPLKSVLQWTGGTIGGLFGNEEVGRMIGGGVYYLGDIAMWFSFLPGDMSFNEYLFQNMDAWFAFSSPANKAIWFYELYDEAYDIGHTGAEIIGNPYDSLAH